MFKAGNPGVKFYKSRARVMGLLIEVFTRKSQHLQALTLNMAELPPSRTLFSKDLMAFRLDMDDDNTEDLVQLLSQDVELLLQSLPATAKRASTQNQSSWGKMWTFTNQFLGLDARNRLKLGFHRSKMLFTWFSYYLCL
jgi:hypothetical protein